MLKSLFISLAALLLLANADSNDGWQLLENGREADALEEARTGIAADDPEAFGLMGAIYENGAGLEQDNAKAAEFYRQGAERGDSYSMWRLGVLIDMGEAEGTPKDAVALFRTAADAGNASAMASLAVMHASGRGVPQDFDAAFALYERTARAGEPHGHYGLGVMYHLGEGRDADLVTAVAHWLVGALEGNDSSEGALVQAGSQLTMEQRRDAVTKARAIAERYGNKVALANLRK